MSVENVYLTIINDYNAVDSIRRAVQRRASRGVSMFAYNTGIPMRRACEDAGIQEEYRELSRAEQRLAWNACIENIFCDDEEYKKSLTKAEPLKAKKEEKIMSVTVENKTFVNGVDVNTLDAANLLGSVKQLETEIRDLKSVEISSKYVEKKIKELEETLKKVVKLLDSKA